MCVELHSLIRSVQISIKNWHKREKVVYFGAWDPTCSYLMFISVDFLFRRVQLGKIDDASLFVFANWCIGIKKKNHEDKLNKTPRHLYFVFIARPAYVTVLDIIISSVRKIPFLNMRFFYPVRPSLQVSIPCIASFFLTLLFVVRFFFHSTLKLALHLFSSQFHETRHHRFYSSFNRIPHSLDLRSNSWEISSSKVKATL